MNHYLAFDREFFARHQGLILWILNAPILGRWGRWILRINGNRSSVGSQRIERVVPNAIFWGGNRVEFRTHDKYSKRLYYAFRPVWWMMHGWDWLLADRAIPALSFGFATLTVRPDAGSPGTTSVDGSVDRNVVSEAFSTIRNGAGTTAFAASAGDDPGYLAASTTVNEYAYLRRGIYLFDTSAIPDAATISAAVFSLFGYAKTNGLGSPGLDVVATTPASDTTLTASDYGQFGTTVFATKAYAAWDGGGTIYNDFTLDSNGIAAVSLTGVSKFGTRLTWDTSNSFGGAWSSSADSHYETATADQSGTSEDPKLVVTYATVFTTTLTESVTLVDVTLKQPERILVESVNPVDVFTSSFIYAKILLDGIIAVDTFRQVIIAKLLAESLALGDSMIRGLSRTFSDSVTPVDVFARILGKTLTATLNLVTRLFPYLGGLSAGVWNRTPRTSSSFSRRPRPD